MERIPDIEHQRDIEILEEVDIEGYVQFRSCPFCKEELTIERNLFDTDDDIFPELEVPVECENCGKIWFEVYEQKELSVRSE